MLVEWKYLDLKQNYELFLASPNNIPAENQLMKQTHTSGCQPGWNKKKKNKLFAPIGM